MGTAKKEKKNRKHSHSHKRSKNDETEETNTEMLDPSESTKKVKRSREADDTPKRKHRQVVPNEDSDDDDSREESSKNDVNAAEESSPPKKIKPSREEKKQQKEALLEKIPKVDENGISYTKIEIRRMMKRVKRGLPAIMSQEEQAKLEEERRKEKEKEKREWDAMIYDDSDTKSGKKHSVMDLTLEEENEVDDNSNNVVPSESEEVKSAKENATDDEKNTAPQNRENAGKSSRKKPVPIDYICKACNNDPACGEPHWIYDCPQKKHMPGTNKVRKKDRGVIQPDTEHKVFVSGLPFHVSHMAVEAFFRKKLFSKDEEPSNSHDKKKLVRCKLVLFRDTLECRGQAFVMFASIEMTKRALELDGVEWEVLKKNSGEGKRWLKIEPVKGRNEMKAIKRQKKWHEQTKLRTKMSKTTDPV